MTAKKILLITISATAVFAAFLGIRVIFAAPTCGTGDVCSVLTTDGSGNFGIGANSDSVSRLFIKDADTSTTKNGLKIISSDGSTPVFVVRNDGLVTLASSTSFANAGLVFPDGSKQVVAFTGAASSITAGNVSAGSFGSNLGGGVYSFPAALAVGTTTLTGLPTNGLYVGGNVGIGTINPGYKLEVSGGNAKFSGSVQANGFSLENSNMVFGSGAYNFFKPYMSSPSANSELSTGKSLYLNIDADGNETGMSFIFGHNANGSSASPLMVISDSGNVGIATTTPTYPLTVAGTIHSSTGGYRFPDGTTQTTAATAGINYFTLSGTSLYPTSTTYSLGVGTTTPAYKLDVSNGATTAYPLQLTSSGKYIRIGALNSTYAHVDTDTTGGFYFYDGVRAGDGNNFLSAYTGNSFLAATGGNVGIGTSTAPSAKLDIYGGNLRVGDGTLYVYRSGADAVISLSSGAANEVLTGGWSTSGFAYLQGGSWGGTTKSLILQGGGGNVGINTTSATYPLTVAGTIHSSTGGYRFPDGTTQTTAATGGASYFTLSGNSLYPTSTAYNLGIGTTTPAYPLVISSTNANPIMMGLTGSSASPVSIGIGRTAVEGRIGIAHAGGAFATDAAAGDVVIRTESNTNSVRILGGAGATVLQVSSSTVTVVGGTGKINVGTVDPPYTINGEQYATYMAGMTGQKEETTGEIRVTCNAQRVTCETSIDFGTQEKGSDLWLFAKTTNLAKQMDRMTVLLTPSFNGKVWYEKDAKNNVLKIFGTPSEILTEKDDFGYSVSYRLTAPRFDADKWLNTRNEKDVPGLIINY